MPHKSFNVVTHPYRPDVVVGYQLLRDGQPTNLFCFKGIHGGPFDLTPPVAPPDLYSSLPMATTRSDHDCLKCKAWPNKIVHEIVGGRQRDVINCKSCGLKMRPMPS